MKIEEIELCEKHDRFEYETFWIKMIGYYNHSKKSNESPVLRYFKKHGKYPNSGKKLPDEVRKKIAKSNTGYRFSEESKKKMSESRIGKVSWNKGTVGVVKKNSGSFDGSKPAPNKGRKKVIMPDGRVRYIKSHMANATGEIQ